MSTLLNITRLPSRMLFTCTALVWAASLAQATEPIVRVEEDWELVVVSADSNSASPQVVCTMAPTGDLDGKYFTFELNYVSLPEFEPGGLHVQAFDGQYPLNSGNFPNGDVMSTPDEVVRWTQVLELQNGVLTFEIVDGSSETWGAFGGQGYLKVAAPTELESLSGYLPTSSVENSGVSYGGNRVQSLAIRAVRVTLANGDELESTSLRTVHELP